MHQTKSVALLNFLLLNIFPYVVFDSDDELPDLEYYADMSEDDDSGNLFSDK